MAWLRIEDTVPHHPKFLKAGPIAAWLWVCGLAYCQRQLTDGFIPRNALPFLGFSTNDTDRDENRELGESSVRARRELVESYKRRERRRPVRAKRELVESYARAKSNMVFRYAKTLVRAGLFDVVPGGYKVHDYLDYNESKVQALERKALLKQVRSEAGKAGAASRWQKDGKPHGNLPSVLTSLVAPYQYGKTMAPSHTPTPLKKKEQAAAKVRGTQHDNGSNGHAADAFHDSQSTQTNPEGQDHSHPTTTQNQAADLVYKGPRFVIFEWMMDGFSKILGPHYESFNLPAWFPVATQKLLDQKLILPRDQRWAWLQEECAREAARRGLPLPDKPFTKDELRDAKQTRRSLGRCPHNGMCESYTDCLHQIIREGRHVGDHERH